MEIVYFTLAAIALYVLSDWILNRVETLLGKRLPQRSLFFFGILLVLALTTFSLIQKFAS